MADWITEQHDDQAGTYQFTVRQRKFSPLKRLGMLMISAVIVVGAFAGLAPFTSGITLLFAFLFGFVFLLAIAIGAIAAAIATVKRSRYSTITVTQDLIRVASGGRNREFERSTITDFYAHLAGTGAAEAEDAQWKARTASNSAASMGGTAGGLGAMVLHGSKSYVAANSFGKEVFLARYLNDDEASYLVSRLNSVL